MFSIRRIIVVDKKAFLCLTCVLSVYIVVNIRTRSHLVRSQIHNATEAREPDVKHLSVFAVFLVFPPNTNQSTESGQTPQQSLKAGHVISRYLKLPNCDTTKSFHLYLLSYTEELTTAAKESFKNYLNESFGRCQRHVPIVVDDFLIKDPTMDGRFLRDVILGAYLDSVDYYEIVLSDALPDESETEVDLSHWKDILRHSSPSGIGVVATSYRKESRTVSKLFFSKVHIDIFGAAFPVRISTLESALSYVVELYSSNRLAIIVDWKTKMMDTKMPPGGHASAAKWTTEQLDEDTVTLNSYQSALKASRGSWRSISSSGNVIAMSLYGDKRRYTLGALRNAQLLPVIFPGWRLWFYCEQPRPDGSVKYGKIPDKILRKIAELGAEIRYVDAAGTGLAPMLWRFLVAEDMTVDAFEVRDCDSRLTLRDAAVISDWLRTNASFHCIRDHPSHSHYSVSGGLWGGRPRQLFAILNGTMRSMMTRYGAGYLADMNFLGTDVWPKVKDFAFCHDSFSCQSFPASHPFPVKRIGYEHLGQVYDENSVGRQNDINILASAAVNGKCVPSA